MPKKIIAFVLGVAMLAAVTTANLTSTAGATPTAGPAIACESGSSSGGGC